ncbi:GGDEF domain-containing protein [Desulfobulbus rhabdoformis]|uniref:sensor domain-containing diguanylate cyclase n=1 Tax=Desulfobulbus rhabdoformis TaxID=34032 RepID=UPI001964BBFE|nr:GGDEF domain-containing protein [Desulfobulbus rhabdoformis]MBM9614906.1 GGDEF domain-containing protein [Desulfobulbus rhabdoformis]
MSRVLNRTLQNILSSADLPTLPVVASKVLELTTQEEVEVAEVIHLISQDIALSTKILKVANSAFYNFPQQIGSVQQAVSLLGINAVRSLVLSFTFLSMGEENTFKYFDLNGFWRLSLVRAAAARLISQYVGEVDPEELFTQGLLQNIGQLIFALTLPERYDTLLEELEIDNTRPDESLEEEYLGLAHTVSGAEVARCWCLPQSIVDAIRYHHAPAQYEGADCRNSSAVKIVYLSEMLARIFQSNMPIEAQEEFEEDARKMLGLPSEEIGHILKIINKKVTKSAQFFGVEMEPVRSVTEIIQEANIRLSLLHLSYEEMNRELQQAKNSLEELTAELTEKNHQLEQLANIDGLTEIHNHRYFQTFLRTELRRAKENNLPLTLLLADIDHFKQFNDRYGHQTGDFILKELCRAVLPMLRDYDLMARYGGEEFTFVLPDTSADGSLAVAQKICRLVAEHPFSNDSACYQVTLSIGATTIFPAETAISANECIDQADRALYEAKNRGRNQAISFHNLSRTNWLRM